MRRVFVTGLGPICALGQDAEEFWANLLAGKSGIGKIARLAGCSVEIGAEVRGFQGERKFDRVAQFALAAARRAILHAGIDSGEAGIILGSSRGAAESMEAAYKSFFQEGRRVSPRTSPLTTLGNLGGVVSSQLGLRGPLFAVSAACSSASHAIGVAFDMVRTGRADVMLAGGAEACLTPFCIEMFAATGILSKTAARPFDRDRDGCVVGEGAGVVVLESEDRLRGRTPICELLGYGAAADAKTLTGVPEDGEGLARAIRQARGVREVAYVNAHGTGTVLGDRAESAALKPLGAAVSSTKSMTGHLIGAAGGIEAIVCALAVSRGEIPPTINLENPEFDLDLPRAARKQSVPVALSTSMGFGGNNACLAFGAAE